MAQEGSGSRSAEALVSIGELLRDVYEKDRPDFSTLSSDERARLEYTTSHLVDYVGASMPAAGNQEAVAKLESHLLWLWGVMLSHSIPIRRTLGDERFDKLLREHVWIDDLVDTQAEGAGHLTKCGHCGRSIPGMGFALCAHCQVDGYRECKHCEQRVATTTNPYCDVCAEEIVGTG